MSLPRFILQPAERYPADPRAVFILALSIFSGIGYLIYEEAPGSLEATLPEWGIPLWSLGLGIGSFLALAGLVKDSVNGILVEQVGSAMVAASTLFYSAIAFWVIGGSAGQPVMIVLGWGIACGIRWIQLQLLLRRIHAQELVLRAEKLAAELLKQQNDQ